MKEGTPEEKLQHQIAAANELAAWMQSVLANAPMKGDDLSQTAAALFGVSLVHLQSILALAAGDRRGAASAFALERPQLEAFLRGAWLLADPDPAKALDTFNNRPKQIPGLPQLVKIVQAKEGDLVDVLEHHVRVNSADLHGFTHGGVQHVKNWRGGSVLGPDYPVTDVMITVENAWRIGSAAAAGAAQMSTDVQRFATLSAGIAPRRPPMMTAYFGPPTEKPA